MIIILLVLLAAFSFALIRSADFVVISLKRITRKTSAKSFALAAIFLALGTSFPEMFVGITSALEKSPGLTLGVVIGSNIANISLIVGIAGIAAGRIYIRGEFFKRDVLIALVAGLAPLILFSDGALSRPDGVILLAIYVAYAMSFFKVRYQEIGKKMEADITINKIVRSFNAIDKGVKRDYTRLLLGLAILLASADAVVRIGKALAFEANIPVFVVGLVVLAIGTSLPELAFSFRSLRSGESGMFFGNILGSTIANSTLIIGLTVLISPITAKNQNGNLQAAAIAFVIISLMFWYFTRSKKRLDWWEAGILVLAYIAFVFFELT